mmetsp:Transcript_18862/g.23994  ORF Transcript_18862/g.23994 Transcript_18862/m.23994 type:complete len:83 (-) Transcript_18862:22-270(-)
MSQLDPAQNGLSFNAYSVETPFCSPLIVYEYLKKCPDASSHVASNSEVSIDSNSQLNFCIGCGVATVCNIVQLRKRRSKATS